MDFAIQATNGVAQFLWVFFECYDCFNNLSERTIVLDSDPSYSPSRHPDRIHTRPGYECPVSLVSCAARFFDANFMYKLRITTNWFYVAMLLCISAITAGCVAVGDQRSLNDSDQLMKEAQEALRSGAKIRAQKLFEDASKVNPADKTSWINLAQLHFDEGNYAQAVMAGQEVLARDPKDQVARSIILVSSLRVAAKSLAEMRELNQWTGDARAEAKKVASILREKLGEDVLVPDLNSHTRKETIKSDLEANEKKAIKVKTKPKPKVGSTPLRPLGNSPSPSASPAPSPPAGSRADPFGSLR